MNGHRGAYKKFIGDQHHVLKLRRIPPGFVNLGDDAGFHNF